jgi:hypothetical protein
METLAELALGRTGEGACPYVSMLVLRPGTCDPS